MRLLDAAATRHGLGGTDVHQAQLADRDAEFEQREILGDGEILTVATALGHGFEWRGPVIGLAPQREIVVEGDALVDEVVDPPDLFLLAAAAGTAEHAAPVFEQCQRLLAVAGEQCVPETFEIQSER